MRANALLLHGTPVSSLPTARIFAYATHFDARPVALEWVNDDTCGTRAVLNAIAQSLTD
jgi:hypothetical protein